jgi:hypothetical protein
MGLFLEIIAFHRKVVKVAPISLKPACYLHAAEAMMGLRKLDEAEEILHEGLTVCRQEGLRLSMVS